MNNSGIEAVTGGLGYTGRHIVPLLLERNKVVRTLTNSPHRPNPFGGRLDVRPMDFSNTDSLARALEGVSVLYNTYWVRFNHRKFCHADAVSNTVALFEAARRAGVKRIVHVSITNPSENSPLEYFRGKGYLERRLRETGIGYAILRPAVFFGGEDILINNIAWMLRRFPVFGVFVEGNYRLQPIFIKDFAELAVREGLGEEDTVINAIGPETFSYRKLATVIGEIIGCRRPVLSIHPALGYAIGRVVGKMVGDVLITREEVDGLMAGLLAVDDVPAGETKLTDWARQHSGSLGKRYASELARRQSP